MFVSFKKKQKNQPGGFVQIRLRILSVPKKKVDDWRTSLGTVMQMASQRLPVDEVGRLMGVPDVPGTWGRDCVTPRISSLR